MDYFEAEIFVESINFPKCTISFDTKICNFKNGIGIEGQKSMQTS